MFDNAAEKGAECYDRTRVLAVLFDGPRATGVRLQTDQGASREVACRVVVDATGQQALIAHAAGLRVDHPQLRTPRPRFAGYDAAR